MWAVAVLPDGTMVSGDSTGGLAFWDAQFGTQLCRFEHRADVLAVAASPAGDAVFASGIDPRVCMYKPVPGAGASHCPSSCRLVMCCAMLWHAIEDRHAYHASIYILQAAHWQHWCDPIPRLPCLGLCFSSMPMLHVLACRPTARQLAISGGEAATHSRCACSCGGPGTRIEPISAFSWQRCTPLPLIHSSLPAGQAALMCSIDLHKFYQSGICMAVDLVQC